LIFLLIWQNFEVLKYLQLNIEISAYWE